MKCRPQRPFPPDNRRAFTLIEVLVVVAIIAILAGMVLGIAGFAMRKADESRATADLEKIRTAIENYRLTYGRYPVNNIEATNSTILSQQLWVKPLAEGRKPFLVMKGWSNPLVASPINDPWGTQFHYFHDPGTGAMHNSGSFGYDLWVVAPDQTTNINNWSSQ